jgi:hypothetical protein
VKFAHFFGMDFVSEAINGAQDGDFLSAMLLAEAISHGLLHASID